MKQHRLEKDHNLRIVSNIFQDSVVKENINIAKYLESEVHAKRCWKVII